MLHCVYSPFLEKKTTFKMRISEQTFLGLGCACKRKLGFWRNEEHEGKTRHESVPDMFVHPAREVHVLDQSTSQVSWRRFLPLYPQMLPLIFLATLTNTSSPAQGTGGANRVQENFLPPNFHARNCLAQDLGKQQVFKTMIQMQIFSVL